MSVTGGSLGNRGKNALQFALLILGVWFAFSMALPHLCRIGGLATGLGANADRDRAWSSQSRSTFMKKGIGRSEVASSWSAPLTASVAGYLGGIAGGISQAGARELPPSAREGPDRKIVRTSSLQIEVQSPDDTLEKIRALTEQANGYLVNSDLGGSRDFPGANITIRVPVPKFDQVRAEIRKLATRIDSDRTEANDVTKDYVDKEARLRNLRAQETQYRMLLKRATTVKDILEVSDKLNEVRGAIEQQQAEFEALSKQVETVAITVSLRAEADTEVFGIRRRPLYNLKVAARDGVDSLATYFSTLASGIFLLPAVVLWLATLVLVLAIGWRIVRWIWRVFFVSSLPWRPRKAVS